MSASDGVLDDLIFPRSISAVCSGRRGRLTSVASNQAGFEQRNAVWSHTRRRYEIGMVVRRVDEWEQIDAIHEVAGGREWAFLFRDPTDGKVTPTQGILRPLDAAGEPVGAVGAGYGVPMYRLVKRYSFGSNHSDRDIRKPASGTIGLLRDSVAVTLGALAGNAAIDATTGNVTFVADETESPTSITVGATTVLNFTDGTGIVAALDVGHRVYLSDVTGTAASALNSLSHEITAKGASSLTVSTSTSGLAITSPGTAAKYPQADEPLAWSGQFYVPVRFDADELDWSMVAGHPDEDSRLVEGPSILLVEVRIP